MSRRGSLLVFLALVVGGGLAIGTATTPGDWYTQLHKPAFNPPGWIFGPVWTLLYVLIAIAGWRIWFADPRGLSMWLWWTQLVLNFLWSPIFFSAHEIGLALVVVLLLLGAILGFVAVTLRHDRVAAGLFVPYAAWVAFAAVLNGAIYASN